MYKILRTILFLLPAEKAHYFTLNALQFIYKLPFGKEILNSLFNYQNQNLEQDKLGLHFSNHVGLAAGFDKNAKYIDALACLGFGFIEIGTVTPLAQEGNPTPRLFRLTKDEAIINRMGFNNDGVDAVVERLKRRKSHIIVGGNIGKNKITPNEKAVNDYVICFEKLFDYVDYFVVNVSSPNTPNLRELQEKAALQHLLGTLQKINIQKDKPKPILLKIAPDLNENELIDVIEVIIKTNIAGIISNNTTIGRKDLKTDSKKIENIGNGGLSGKPIYQKSNDILKFLKQHLPNDKVLIGVGGINSEKDAIEKLNLGADLIQLYSGFIYKGPALINKINKTIINTKTHT